MNSSTRRSTPLTRDHRANGLVGPRLTVIFFGVGAEVLEACLPVARDLRIGRTNAKHLHAACSALDVFRGAMLVVSTAIRQSERDVIADRAQRANASVLWVADDHDADDIVLKIETWATDAMRPQR